MLDCGKRFDHLRHFFWTNQYLKKLTQIHSTIPSFDCFSITHRTQGKGVIVATIAITKAEKEDEEGMVKHSTKPGAIFTKGGAIIHTRL